MKVNLPSILKVTSISLFSAALIAFGYWAGRHGIEVDNQAAAAMAGSTDSASTAVEVVPPAVVWAMQLIT